MPGTLAVVPRLVAAKSRRRAEARYAARRARFPAPGLRTLLAGRSVSEPERPDWETRAVQENAAAPESTGPGGQGLLLPAVVESPATLAAGWCRSASAGCSTLVADERMENTLNR